MNRYPSRHPYCHLRRLRRLVHAPAATTPAAPAPEAPKTDARARERARELSRQATELVAKLNQMAEAGRSYQSRQAAWVELAAVASEFCALAGDSEMAAWFNWQATHIARLTRRVDFVFTWHHFCERWHALYTDPNSVFYSPLLD